VQTRISKAIVEPPAMPMAMAKSVPKLPVGKPISAFRVRRGVEEGERKICVPEFKIIDVLTCQRA
jgi:hypothetical protein